MRSLVHRGGTLVCLLVSWLLFVTSFCDAAAFEVIGDGECADCAENSFETRQAFSGLRVTIDCKPEKGENFETRGSGELDDEGKFKVSLAGDMVKDASTTFTIEKLLPPSLSSPSDLQKPLPPPVPVYKPPVYKPHPVPVYKPPVYKPHPVPIYKPKPHPLPTIPKIHPIPKKPCPPIPKLHPKYFHHPKFGKWPPFAPHQP
ncbi:hypothetical protein F3Y22_tig00112740pilonHSYRG00002 [Hibiscus syriacus]|uniref:Uncharacterized protein n=1 Tax=Hibiscus syriacus TaxID=106335 RepID=A0A6A2Y3H2_HIBSY|nr:hypothetical protein F3Y22_tig00112740pilonHSYRG00002 [Hibiscus syriacus]